MPHIKWFWRYLFSIVLFALPTYSSVVYSQPPVADTGEIDGTVYRRESGRRLANVNVRLIETNQHTLTDEKGGFGFSNVPAGEYTLTVSASGYRTPEDEAVTVKPGQTTEVQLYLEGVEFLLEEIRVTSPRPPVTVGRQTVGALEVKRVPGTASDAIRALAALPGIGVANDFIGELYHFDFQMHLFCGNIKDAISPKSLDIIWRFLCPRK